MNFGWAVGNNWNVMMESQFLCNNSRTKPILYKLIESHSFSEGVEQFWVRKAEIIKNNMVGEMGVFDSQKVLNSSFFKSTFLFNPISNFFNPIFRFKTHT